MEKLNCFIGGAWVEGSSGKWSRDVNPANTDDVIALATVASREDAVRAVEAAAKAFPAWRAKTAPERARVLARVSELAKARVDSLAAIMTREEGKTLREARGEILKGLNLIDFFVGEGWRLGGKTTPSEMPSTFTYTIRQPLGVAALITPWNFPWAIPCWKIAPALVAGNTAVLKPASATPKMAVELVRLFEEAGLPPGVLNLVLGSGGTVGDALVSHKAVRAVSFTGSNDVGTKLHAAATARQARCTCEMGGKNPVVVLADADLALATEGIVQGAFGSTGQRCTATSRVVVHRSVVHELTDRLIERTRALKVGNGADSASHVGPVVDEAQLRTVLHYIGVGKEDGAKLLLGGSRLSDGAHAKGFFVAPTIFGDVTPSMRIAREEVFGPVLAILAVDSFDEALSVANDVDYGLTSAIYANDPGVLMRFIERSEVGIVHVNSPTVGGEAQLPFGGSKATGTGWREMSEEGIHFFTEPKTVYFDYTGTKRDTNIY